MKSKLTGDLGGCECLSCLFGCNQGVILPNTMGYTQQQYLQEQLKIGPINFRAN